MIYAGIALLFVLMFCIAGPFIPSWNWKMIWLGVTLATGIHFLSYFFVHGRSMIVLGIICSMIAIVGYTLSAVPVVAILVADSLVKIGFGIWMLMVE